MAKTDRGAEFVWEFATFLGRHPRVRDDVLREHRDDGTGHCTVCSAGGQTGRLTWPCRLHAAVCAAADLTPPARVHRRPTRSPGP